MLYIEHFTNKGHDKLLSVPLVLVGLWILAVINLPGVKNMGLVQVRTKIVKFAALAFMATVGPVLHQHRRAIPLAPGGHHDDRHADHPGRHHRRTQTSV